MKEKRGSMEMREKKKYFLYSTEKPYLKVSLFLFGRKRKSLHRIYRVETIDGLVLNLEKNPQMGGVRYGFFIGPLSSSQATY